MPRWQPIEDPARAPDAHPLDAKRGAFSIVSSNASSPLLRLKLVPYPDEDALSGIVDLAAL
jgi:hypothetical protein